MKRILLLAMIALVCASVFASGNAEDEPIIWVWYPNESTPEFAPVRAELIGVAERALGREIEEQLTTDYAIAIEALVNENATFSWFGGEGYVQAHDRNSAIRPLVVNSGASGTLEDAKYYSMIGTLVENAQAFKTNGEFDLEKLRQTKFSFVSNSSTSGFRVPSSILSSHFNIDPQDLLEGGPNEIFAEVMFGGSHQGSFFNVLDGRADAGAFCNGCIDDYVEWEGDFSDPLPGDVIRVIPNAAAPFDKVPGKEIVFIATVPVLNAPLVVNSDMLSEEDLDRVIAAFTAEETTNNEGIFGESGVFRAGERFLPVEDAWYDPIRRLAGN